MCLSCKATSVVLTLTFGFQQFLEMHHPIGTCLHKEISANVGTDTMLHVGDVYDNWTEVEIAVK